jgi:DNA-binding transcriptional LysR family regulator
MLKQVRDADLHLLRVFVAVVECGGLSAAQERLNVASSTISTQISSLETRLGFRLCERGRAGFSLTNEGQVVLDSAYKLFKDLGEFLSTVEAMKGNLVGTISIVLLDNMVQNPAFKLSSALATLKKNQPFLNYAMFQLPPGQLENAVLKREADIGIAWTSTRLPSLTRIKLFEERQFIYCGRGHPLFPLAPDKVPAADLETMDWVRRGYRVPSNFPYASPPISSAVAHHMESMAHLILSGNHIGYLPEQYAMPWVQQDLLRPISPKKLSHSVNFYMITRSDNKDDRIVSAMTKALKEAHDIETEKGSS